MTTTLTARLEELKADYTYRVNGLLTQNREDLAAELASQYPDDAARLMSSTQEQAA